MEYLFIYSIYVEKHIYNDYNVIDDTYCDISIMKNEYVQTTCVIFGKIGSFKVLANWFKHRTIESFTRRTNPEPRTK